MAMESDKFTESAEEALRFSQELVRRFRHAQWDVEHVFLALLEQENSVPLQLLVEMEVDVAAVKSDLETALERTPKLQYEPTQMYATPRVSRMVQDAKTEADRLKDDFISTEHLFIAISQERAGDSAEVLRSHDVDTEKIYVAPSKVRGSQRVDDPRAESRYRSLEKYTVDLTQLAREGHSTPWWVAMRLYARPSRRCLVAPRTTPYFWARPVWARPPWWRGWPSTSCPATCRMC